jgi:putative peptidoglycan lipid II flippase
MPASSDMRGAATPQFSLQAVGRSAFILTAGAALAQVLAVGRELYLAAQLGVAPALDALFIALVLPTTLAGVLTSGVVTALVPAYMGLRARAGTADARRFAGGVLAWVGLLGLALTAGLVVLRGVAVGVTGPGLDEAGREAAIGYLGLLAPLAFVAAVSAVLQALCQAEERFVGIAAANLAAPAVTLAAMLALWGSLGLTSVAIGSVLGPAVGASVLFITSARAGMTPRLTLRLPRSELAAFAAHAAPLTVSAAVLQVNTIVDRAIASLLVPGGVSALRFAELLIRAPIGTIAPAWGSAIYPALVRAAGSPDAGALGHAAGRAIRYGIAIFLPVAVLTAAVAPVAVATAYARGAFGADDVALTIPIVAAFAPLVLILMVSPVLTGALNARQRGRVLLAGGTLNAILNLVLDVGLGSVFGVVGIALSSSIASAVVLLFFVRRLAATEPELDVPGIARTLTLGAIAAAPGAAIVAVIAWSGTVPSGLVPGLAALAAFGVFGVAAYAVGAWLLQVGEVRVLIQSARGWLAQRQSRSSAGRPAGD